MSSRMTRLDADAPEPNVTSNFSSWVPWAKRLDIPDGHEGYAHTHGGVYLLAHFESAPPPGPANGLDDAIVYIGEGGVLKRRWNQFQRASFGESDGHSGGRSHRAWREQTGVRWETLHVAAFPIQFQSDGKTDGPMSLARRFRLYVEQLLLWRLAAHRRGRNLPLLNRK